MHSDLEGRFDGFVRVYSARTRLVPAGTNQVCMSDGLLEQTHLESRAAMGEASGAHAML